MAVSVADNKVIHECNGVQTEFAIARKYFNNTDIKVYIVNADDTLTLQTEGVEYTLASTDKNLGGTVTFGTAPADDKQVLIVRQMTLNQGTSFKPNTNFPEQVVEAALDKLTMICQQVQEVVNRCVQFPLNSDKTSITLPEPVAGKSIKWTATLDGFENTDTDIDEAIAAAEALVDLAQGYAADAASQVGLAADQVSLAEAEVVSATEQVALAADQVALAEGHANDAAQSAIDAATYAALITPEKQLKDITLVQGNWNLVSGIYEYDLANENIAATSSVDFITDDDYITIVNNAAPLMKTISSSGSVKLRVQNAPTGDIVGTLHIKGVI